MLARCQPGSIASTLAYDCVSPAHLITNITNYDHKVNRAQPKQCHRSGMIKLLSDIMTTQLFFGGLQ